MESLKKKGGGGLLLQISPFEKCALRMESGDYHSATRVSETISTLVLAHGDRAFGNTVCRITSLGTREYPSERY